MRYLSPSILSADFYNLGKDIDDFIETGAKWVHIDVMDGHFVPPLTFGSKIVSDIKKHNKNAFCDVHLMVDNPEDQVPQFISAGADLINFHIEASNHADRFINLIKESNRMAAISINPQTPVSVIKHLLPIVDMVLVMSVNPGYSGQKCIEYNFDKIIELDTVRKDKGYKYLIQIDGGITINNLKQVLDINTDSVVMGSGYFNADMATRKEIVRIMNS